MGCNKQRELQYPDGKVPWQGIDMEIDRLISELNKIRKKAKKGFKAWRKNHNI
jgi:hypothetical protein